MDNLGVWREILPKIGTKRPAAQSVVCVIKRRLHFGLSTSIRSRSASRP
ncbi:hypothetical protein THF1C08_330051 [Vibrio jasicida]|uniref:Transposase n=1 Tax=Vibrio jasicida TaxID=766224 RepID=A0AAU9QQC8_9VIBR|nr:hypothetical protein THF1C08_330051 [Vibrio jasicida]CAH1597746.1 hypothetical protein THF1A12_330053 [Vibrio jasicida]